MLKKWMICLMALMLLWSATAAAEEITVEEIRTQIGSNYVSYPQLSGMADASLQQKINDDIVLSSGVANHMVTLATLSGSPWKLTVDYRVCLLDDRVFSAVISAMGKLPGQRDGHAYTALTYDLTTGERLTLADIFTNPDAAAAQMEAIAEKSLAEELNGYMEYADIVPLPADSFTLDGDSITFWYPFDQFSLLSGYSGACQFWYEELEGLWAEERLPMTDDEIRASVAQTVADGRLPKVPAAMGESMQKVTEAYRLLRTPDEFPGGRYFVLEDPAFRQVLVISGMLEENAVVEGLQLKRGGLCGFVIGKTSQERWRQVLGQPEETIDMTENMAYDYNLPMGQYDVYHYGGNELRLYADLSGVLCAVQLCK